MTRPHISSTAIPVTSVAEQNGAGYKKTLFYSQTSKQGSRGGGEERMMLDGCEETDSRACGVSGERGYGEWRGRTWGAVLWVRRGVRAEEKEEEE